MINLTSNSYVCFAGFWTNLNGIIQQILFGLTSFGQHCICEILNMLFSISKFHSHCWEIFCCRNYHNLFICSVDVHLACFQFLTVMRSIALSISIGENLYTFLLGICLGEESLGHKVMYLCLITRYGQIVPQSCPVCSLTRSIWEFQLLHIFAKSRYF